ncbi:hypothetical protein TNCV_305691 [Trichonephila clavipes]|nr:hypothetical protein TNCV_305691 [Trichonephila clavipes]
MRRKVRILFPVLTRKTISRRPFSIIPSSGKSSNKKRERVSTPWYYTPKKKTSARTSSPIGPPRGVEQKHRPTLPPDYLLTPKSELLHTLFAQSELPKRSARLHSWFLSLLSQWRRDPSGELIKLRTKSGIMHWEVLVSPCMR